MGQQRIDRISNDHITHPEMHMGISIFQNKTICAWLLLDILSEYEYKLFLGIIRIYY